MFAHGPWQHLFPAASIVRAWDDVLAVVCSDVAGINVKRRAMHVVIH